MAQRKVGSTKRPRSTGTQRTLERIEVGGHSIEVRGRPGADEELYIDGERRRFFVTSGGYHLADDAYRPAEKSLADAARRYIAREADQGR